MARRRKRECKGLKPQGKETFTTRTNLGEVTCLLCCERERSIDAATYTKVQGIPYYITLCRILGISYESVAFTAGFQRYDFSFCEKCANLIYEWVQLTEQVKSIQKRLNGIKKHVSRTLQLDTIADRRKDVVEFIPRNILKQCKYELKV
jgi:hypothetical protein